MSHGEKESGAENAWQILQSRKTEGPGRGSSLRQEQADPGSQTGPRRAERSESVTAAPWTAYKMPGPRADVACCPLQVCFPFQEQAVLDTWAITEDQRPHVGPATWRKEHRSISSYADITRVYVADTSPGLIPFISQFSISRHAFFFFFFSTFTVIGHHSGERMSCEECRAK